jgi:hypothetical protein
VGRRVAVAGVEVGAEEGRIGLAVVVVGAGLGIAVVVVAGGIAGAVAAAGVEEDGFAQVDEACGRGAHGGGFVLPFSCRALLGRLCVLARLG